MKMCDLFGYQHLFRIILLAQHSNMTVIVSLEFVSDSVKWKVFIINFPIFYVRISIFTPICEWSSIKKFTILNEAIK